MEASAKTLDPKSDEVAPLSPRLSGADDDLVQYLSADGELLPGRQVPMSDEEATRLYVAMVRNRLLDERMVMLQRQGRIGFYIGSVGEEASIIGPIGALKANDWLFPCYRENGGYLLRGMPLQRLIDNLFGNGNDPVLGRQMPNHISWRQANITSISSPIGTQIPQATGAAYAARVSGRDDVMMVYFGEGATSSNDFHTGMTFAGVWKVPAVFVCRNNHWAISVPREKQCGAERFVDKAIGYGMPGVRVDGNDLLATYAVAQEAIERARNGGGPTFIEAVTYRISGHSTSDDPTVYRPDATVEPWRQKEPLLRMRKFLTGRGLWSDAQEEALRTGIEDEIRAAVQAAEKAEPPPLESLFRDVFEQAPWYLREQYEEALLNQGGKPAPDGEFPL